MCTSDSEPQMTDLAGKAEAPQEGEASGDSIASFCTRDVQRLGPAALCKKSSNRSKQLP